MTMSIGGIVYASILGQATSVLGFHCGLLLPLPFLLLAGGQCWYTHNLLALEVIPLKQLIIPWAT